MNDDMSPRPKSFSDDRLIQEVREHKKPFVTVSYLCRKLDVSSTAISERLQQLEEDDRILSKKVGASARVWWLPD